MQLSKQMRQALFAGYHTAGSSRAFRVFVVISVLVTFLTLASAARMLNVYDSQRFIKSKAAVVPSCARASDFYLRIMPLGASITKGEPAHKSDPHHNGYRKYLRDKLRDAGWDVNMVGSMRNWGDMSDSDNEGHPGWKVNMVHSRAKATVPLYKPNVILINVGTNDAVFSSASMPYEKAPERMETMLRDLWSMVPDTVIILSTLLPKQDGGKTATINTGYRALGKKLAAEGKPILMAEMDNGKTIVPSDIWDGTHPVPSGFKKMAGVWYSAINEAQCRGLIKPPREDVIYPDGPANKTCAPYAGTAKADDRSGSVMINATADGISGDGPFKPKFDHAASKANAKVVINNKIMFAQLINRSSSAIRLDDMVIVSSDKISLLENKGFGTFGTAKTLGKLPFKCDKEGIVFGDVNNDGLADFLCVAKNGSVQAATNTGSSPVTFKSIGTWHKGGRNFSREGVRFADIDGDGRLDYCFLNNTAGVGHCWRNAGTGAKPSFFQELSSDASNVFGRTVKNVTSVQFVDINGDGRYDWVQINDTGSITIRSNQRSAKKGLIPSWLDTPGNHNIPGFSIATDSSSTVKFGHIFGTARSDIALVRFTNCKRKECSLSVTAYKNNGSGGKFQLGDGSRFADMRKRRIDDYVWISPTGQILLRRNQNEAGKVNLLKDKAYTAPISILNTTTDRRALHVADWDGDGYADIIAVNKTSGRLKIWLNKHSKTTADQDFMWEIIETNQTACTEGWGVGYFDNGNHIADIDGDGRADILCMSSTGRTTAWLNHKEGLKDIGQVVANLNLDRSNFRFVDSNGDGRADLYWTDKFTGNANLWLNRGMLNKLETRANNSGNAVFWSEPKPAWYGGTKGANELFTNQAGDGRADLMAMDPDTGLGTVFLTTCPGASDDGVMELDIPIYDYKSVVAA